LKCQKRENQKGNQKKEAKRVKYKVLIGLNYGDKRAEVGDIVIDLPKKSITWLLEQGCIEEVGGE